MLKPGPHGWIFLVVAVLIASTIVTATLTAVLTHVLFPGGFLIDVPNEEAPPQIQAPPPEDAAEPASSVFGWRAAVSCSFSLGDVEEAGGRDDARP
jgi:hypothetical protein